MKLTTLACLAIGLIGPATLALAAPPVPQSPQAQPALGRAGAPSVRGSDKRRRSYAACNRASHARSLRGGKRRRFLIRCKLGYERPRTPPAMQQPAMQQPTSQQPGPMPAPAERKP